MLNICFEVPKCGTPDTVESEHLNNDLEAAMFRTPQSTVIRRTPDPHFRGARLVMTGVMRCWIPGLEVAGGRNLCPDVVDAGIKIKGLFGAGRTPNPNVSRCMTYD